MKTLKMCLELISIGLVLISIAAFFTHNVADAIWFGVMGLWTGKLGEGGIRNGYGN